MQPAIQTRQDYKARIAIGLLALAVLVSQVIATQHVHAVDDPSACSVCTHADNVPAVDSVQPSLPVSPIQAVQQSLELPQTQPQPRLTPQVRAPPHL